MDFEISHDVAEQINRIETSLFIPSRVPELRGEPVTLAERMEQYSIPGVSIAVINHDHIEWAKGYGVQDTESQEQVTSETKFQAASISKPVTAAAALRLVEQGRLDLDEDVETYLVSWHIPKSGSWQPSLTLRQLLCHGAGFTVHGFPGYTRNAPLPTFQQVLNGQKPANNDPIRVNALPGVQFRYSGGGYCVLQQVLMDVTRMPFATLMRELVLDPLGMVQSTFEYPLPQIFAESTASGHRTEGHPVYGKWHVYPEMAAAGLWTTPSDLARFALELQRAMTGVPQAFLSQEMVRQMLTPQVEPFIGLGIELKGQANAKRFSHAGGNEGFRCLLEAYAHTGVGGVIMTNSDMGDAVFEEVMSSIAQEYRWPDYLPKEHIAIAVDSSSYSTYIGEYELKPGLIFTVTGKDNQLFLQSAKQKPFELYPETETTYFLKEMDAEVTFVRENQREITELIFKQNTKEMTAKKMKK